jgi:hypothetical protein
LTTEGNANSTGLGRYSKAARASFKVRCNGNCRTAISISSIYKLLARDIFLAAAESSGFL